jgi:lipoyl(octanoyl) transferase
MTFKVKDFGRKDYIEIYDLMRNFTLNRNTSIEDEIWLVEHPPVYTLGLSKKIEHIIDVGNIPVVSTDRGGQVTYHGPGQLVTYLLIDLNRRSYKVKKLVSLIEASVMQYLKECSVDAERKLGAPGVYVDDCKIAALGLRVRRHCTYHGLSLNVNMDLTPFEGINPCGIKGMTPTQLINYKKDITLNKAKSGLLKYLLKYLNQSSITLSDVA